MLLHLSKVFLCLFTCTCTQTWNINVTFLNQTFFQITTGALELLQIVTCKVYIDILRVEKQTFVVLYMPGFIVLCLFLPLIELWNAVEGQLLLVLGRLQTTN